jgi:hypothetical protein
MHRLILVSFIFLFTLFSGESLLLTNQATAAGCCMCGKPCTPLRCTCRGTTPGCPYCALPDTLSMRDIHESRSAFDVQAITSDRLRNLALDRQCPQNTYRLRLLGKRETLVIESTFVQAESPHNTIVAFRASPDDLN